MNAQLEAQLRELLDKEAIREALLRLVRGLDRLDVELVASILHEEVVWEHFNLPEPGYITVRGRAMAERSVDAMRVYASTTHFLPSTLVEVEGDVAWSESYALTCGVVDEDGRDVNYYRALRLLDRWERRDGHTWKIAYRLGLHDGLEQYEPGHQHPAMGVLASGRGRRGDDIDPVYRMREWLSLTSVRERRGAGEGAAPPSAP